MRKLQQNFSLWHQIIAKRSVSVGVSLVSSSDYESNLKTHIKLYFKIINFISRRFKEKRLPPDFLTLSEFCVVVGLKQQAFITHI